MAAGKYNYDQENEKNLGKRMNLENKINLKVKWEKSNYSFGIRANVTINGLNNIDYNSIKYQFTNSKDYLGDNEELYTDGIITEKNSTVEIVKGEGEYFLHILISCKDGEKIEKVSNTSIKVNEI